MYSSKFYKVGAIIGAGLIAIVVTFIILARNNDKKIADMEEEPQSIMSSSNLVENTIDINNGEFKEIEEKTKTAEPEKSSVDKVASVNQNENNGKTQNTKQVNETKPEPKKELTFKYPVNGDVICDYAKDKLVYSNTLNEWITHLGIDIKANKTSVVAASEEGTIKSIKDDPRYGLTVVIEHIDGFSTVYSNLLTAEFVSIGEKVKAGQTIGTVGNTASFEILDEPHLHFEILKDGEQIDPNMYLKK